MSRAKALLECFAIVSHVLDRLLVVVEAAALFPRRRALSLPRLGLPGRASVLRPFISAVRAGTLTDEKSVVITEPDATFLPAGTHTRTGREIHVIRGQRASARFLVTALHDTE